MRFASISNLSSLLGRVKSCAQGGSTADELMEWLARWKKSQFTSSPGLSRSWDRVHALLEDAEFVVSQADDDAISGTDMSTWAPELHKDQLYRLLTEHALIQKHLTKPDVRSLLDNSTEWTAKLERLIKRSECIVGWGRDLESINAVGALAEEAAPEVPFSFQQLRENNWYKPDKITWETLHGAAMVEFSIRFALRGRGGSVAARDVLHMVDNLMQEGFLGSYLSESGMEFNRDWLGEQGSITVTQLLTDGVKRVDYSNVISDWVVGERVRVKETESFGGWREGIITGIFGTSPAVVVDGSSTAYTWEYIERLDDQIQSVVDDVPTPEPPDYLRSSFEPSFEPRSSFGSASPVSLDIGIGLDVEGEPRMHFDSASLQPVTEPL